MELASCYFHDRGASWARLLPSRAQALSGYARHTVSILRFGFGSGLTKSFSKGAKSHCCALHLEEENMLGRKSCTFTIVSALMGNIVCQPLCRLYRRRAVGPCYISNTISNTQHFTHLAQGSQDQSHAVLVC